MSKILIVEDDIVIREELSSLLTRYGYYIKSVNEFKNILDYIRQEEADLILLDINLPYFDGYYICREIRKFSNVPIIIVTSRDSDIDELMSINLGADDFITKPYNIQILLARISALLKRTYGNNSSSELIKYGDLSLNLLNATISYHNKTIELTKNEVKILFILIKRKGNLVSRQRIMEELWKDEMFVDDSTLSVNITRLRKKLNELGIKNMIETRRGLGYIVQ